MSKAASASNGQALSKKAIEIPLYKIVKGPDNREYRVINFDNPDMCKRTGLIEIEVIRKKLEPEIKFSNAYDPDLDLYYGEILGYETNTKNPIWRQYSILAYYKTYDLTKKADSIEWKILSMQSFLIGSPFAKGRPLIKKYDRESEAIKAIQESTIKAKAIEIINKQIPLNEMMDIYRVVKGSNPDGLSPVRLQYELIKAAESKPEEFYNAYMLKNKNLLVIFKRAEVYGLISSDIDGFKYMGQILGITQTAALEYLEKNPAILQKLDSDSRIKDETAQKTFRAMSSGEMQFYQTEEGQISQDLFDLRIQANALNIEHKGMDVDALRLAIDAEKALRPNI